MILRPFVSNYLGIRREADKGGKSGGGEKPPTVAELADQLKNAQQALQAEKEKVATLQGEKDQLVKDLAAEKEKVTKLEGERDQLSKDLAGEKEKVTKLEGEKQALEADKKTSTERAQEIAARGGANLPAKKGSEGSSLEGGKLSEQLAAIKDPGERSAFYRKHKAALMAESNAARKAE